MTKKLEIHGLSKTRFYHIWSVMLQRINNPKNTHYRYYGGRGIKCEWKGFIEFRNDMYLFYLAHTKEFGEKNTTLERIDNNKNYSKSNCKWATVKEQHYNTRNVNKFTYKGKTQTLRQWSDELGISISTLRDRYYFQNLPVHKILSTNSHNPKRLFRPL